MDSEKKEIKKMMRADATNGVCMCMFYDNNLLDIA